MKKTFNESENNYVKYSDTNIKYFNKLWNNIGENKKDSFIRKLYSLMIFNQKLTKKQDFYFQYFLKNGESPYKNNYLTLKN